MWRGFFVSATAATLVKIAHENDLVTLFLPEPSISSLYDFEIEELGIFCLIGLGGFYYFKYSLVGGVLGAAFVKTLELSKKLTKAQFLQTTKGMYLMTISICILSSAFAFPYLLLRV